MLVVASPILSNNRTENVDKQISMEENDWHLVPDGEGKMHIVNIQDVDDDVTVEPSFVAFDQVVFRLFTRNNPTTPQVINIFNDAQLTSSFFNPILQTRFTIHGTF